MVVVNLKQVAKYIQYNTVHFNVMYRTAYSIPPVNTRLFFDEENTKQLNNSSRYRKGLDNPDSSEQIHASQDNGLGNQHHDRLKSDQRRNLFKTSNFNEAQTNLLSPVDQQLLELQSNYSSVKMHTVKPAVVSSNYSDTGKNGRLLVIKKIIGETKLQLGALQHQTDRFKVLQLNKVYNVYCFYSLI